jgi:hypothetical protein
MIAVVDSASNFSSLTVNIPSRLFVAGLIARGSAAGNITAASSTPTPCTNRRAGAYRNCATRCPQSFTLRQPTILEPTMLLSWLLAGELFV